MADWSDIDIPSLEHKRRNTLYLDWNAGMVLFKRKFLTGMWSIASGDDYDFDSDDEKFVASVFDEELFGVSPLLTYRQSGQDAHTIQGPLVIPDDTSDSDQATAVSRSDSPDELGHRVASCIF